MRIRALQGMVLTGWMGCAAAPHGVADHDEALRTAAAGLVLDVGGMVERSTVQLTVSGALPGERVWFIASVHETGPRACAPGRRGVCTDLAGPAAVLGSALADAVGFLRFEVTVPDGFAGTEVFLQAGQPRSGLSSAVVSGVVAQPVADAELGDLVVTEVMVEDNTACDTSDAQFFELHNRSAVPLALDGLVLTENGEDVVIDTSVVLQASGRAVVSFSSGFETCFGYAPDVTHGRYINPGDVFSFGNGTVVFDTVDLVWGGVFFPSLPSVSSERDDADDGVWCKAEDATLNGVLATPGEPNGMCP